MRHLEKKQHFEAETAVVLKPFRLLQQKVLKLAGLNAKCDAADSPRQKVESAFKIMTLNMSCINEYL